LNVLEIPEQQWQAILKRLTVHASFKARKLRWRGCQGGDNQLLPKGHGPDSIAMDAVERVLDGRRATVATTPEELMKDLMGIVDSLISDFVRSPENRQMRAIPESREGTATDGWPALARSDPPGQALEIREEAEKYRALVVDALDGDSELEALFECLANGFEGRSEIATLLGKTESDVTNMKKRLNRILDGIESKARREVKHGRHKSIR
jgi:hypothetical protein